MMKDTIFGGLSRSTYTSKKAFNDSSSALTLEKLGEIYDICIKYEREENNRKQKIVNDPSWQQANRELLDLQDYLFKFGDKRLEDYGIAFRCWYSMQPTSMPPVSMREVQRCEELIKEMRSAGKIKL